MKRIQRVMGIKDVKSIHSVGIRSIPKVQRSSYLDLYMLKREKDRLEKELLSLDKRRNSIRRQLNSINRRIDNLQEGVYKEHNIKTYRNVPIKPLKTISVNY